MVFITKGRKDKQSIANSTKANTVIIDGVEGFDDNLLQAKNFIVVDDPKLEFSKKPHPSLTYQQPRNLLQISTWL